MNDLPSTVQAWVTQAVAGGLSPRSVGKYHVMLHGIFRRAVRDRVILHNPCADTELPKVAAAQGPDPDSARSSSACSPRSPTGSAISC